MGICLSDIDQKRSILQITSYLREGVATYHVSALLSSLVWFFVILWTLTDNLNAAEPYVLIANKNVAANSLSRVDVKAIFLGEKTRWSDGKPIKIVILKNGSVHSDFLSRVVDKTPYQFQNYWKKMMFTGKAGMPLSFEEVQSLVDFVAEHHPGAVGYVPAEKATGQVKIITIKYDNFN